MPGSDIEIDVVIGNLEYSLEQYEALPEPNKPDPESCLNLLTAGEHHRKLGVAYLLTALDTAAFTARLQKSATLYLKLLRLAAGLETHLDYARYLHRARLEPFFDALAAADLTLAKAIAEASVAPYDARYEYEDDYCYALVLHQLLKSDFAVDDPALQPAIERFEKVIGDMPTARWAVTQALLARDAAALAAALTKLIAEHEELYRELGNDIVKDPDGFVTLRFVSIEGLAIKALARKLGIPVADEDRTMPREAALVSKHLMP